MSVPLALLIVKVKHLQQLADGVDCEGKVREIYEAHFGASAPYEINLPTTLLKQLKSLVDSNKFSREMFNEAQVCTAITLIDQKDVIVAMLHSSHWRRYPATPHFSSWVEAKLSDPSFLKKLCEIAVLFASYMKVAEKRLETCLPKRKSALR